MVKRFYSDAAIMRHLRGQQTNALQLAAANRHRPRHAGQHGIGQTLELQVHQLITAIKRDKEREKRLWSQGLFVKSARLHKKNQRRVERLHNLLTEIERQGRVLIC